MFYSILLTIDVLLAIGVIALVLLQHGKGADAGAAFGSGASATVFGSRGSASFLSHATAVLATLFFVNSLGLAYIVTHRPADRSITEQLSDQPSPSVPADGMVGNDPASAPASQDPAPEVSTDSVTPEDVPAAGGSAGARATEREPESARDSASGRSPASNTQPRDDVPR